MPRSGHSPLPKHHSFAVTEDPGVLRCKRMLDVRLTSTLREPTASQQNVAENAQLAWPPNSILQASWQFQVVASPEKAAALVSQLITVQYNARLARGRHVMYPNSVASSRLASRYTFVSSVTAQQTPTYCNTPGKAIVTEHLPAARLEMHQGQRHYQSG